MKQRDAESPTELASQHSVKRKREKRPPLWWRITYEEHMVALVRLLGHEGLPLKDMPEKAKPLVEKFGRERLQEAADEITEYLGDGDDTVVRLTEQARKLAVHLIGPRRPADTVPTGDSGIPPLASMSTPGQPEADVSAIPEDAHKPEGAEAESSETEDASHVEAEHRNWVNHETQCVYRFLMQDCDFIDECRHLAAVCRERAASSGDVESDAEGASNSETSLLAKELEQLVRGFNPLADDSTAFGELLEAALSSVDWYALSESVFERDGDGV